MHRNLIIAVCVAVCVVAIVAGWVIAGTSKTIPTIIANAGTAEPSATAGETSAAITSPTEHAISNPTGEPEPTTGALEAPTTAAKPTAASEPIAAPAPTNAPAVGFVEYTVQKGDVLYTIAQNNNVTVEQILAINTIPNPESLNVGQVIRIPKA